MSPSSNRKPVRWAVYLLAAAVALAAGLVISRYRPHPEPSPAAELASSALVELSFTDLTGNSRTLAEWRGEVLLINFWATWCTPCREEIPMIQAARERYRHQGFEVIGIAIDLEQAVAAYRDELAIRYPLLIVTTDPVEILSRFGNEIGALPHSVMLGADGDILATHTGPLTAAQLERMIQTVL